MAIDVLIVDDDADLRAPLVELLKDEGYSVEELGSSVGLLTKIASTQPRLILLDLTLPGGDIRKIVDEARQQSLLKGRTTLALSGLDEATELAAELGLDGAVRKPFDVMSLLVQVEAICRGRSGADALGSQPLA